ncbi:helix-turn-helix domain-containing protein, partial [Micromonospora sp. NPDC023644]|uniref:helix-turn-helix domain-containing protein n=1 Tax=Micromonospora sp. NPDC023644 TaxID=3154321 RepID=UPI0033F3246C
AALAAGATVAATAAAAGLDPRALHRWCRHLFGYGPKTLARILRMGRALALARAGTPLAEVAARCGYADQAHLTRDVRDLAGVPPTALLSH